jgi:hypothetical protein
LGRRGSRAPRGRRRRAPGSGAPGSGGSPQRARPRRRTARCVGRPSRRPVTRGEDGEPAAVEEDDHGDRRAAGGARGLCRKEESRAEVEGAVDDDVLGGDAAPRGGDGRNGRVKQAEHATVQRAAGTEGGVCDEVSDPEEEPREARHRWLGLARCARHVCHGHRLMMG